MKKLLSVVLIMATLMLSSCFTVVEHIKINNDGSGKVTTTIDMSEMMGMLSMFMPDSLKESFSEIDQMMSNDTDIYGGMRGISNAKTFSDSDYVYNVSYDFADADALNRAMSLGSDNTGLGKGKTKFKIKNKRICRSTSYEEDPDSPLNDLGLDGEEGNELMSMVNMPTYRVVYELPRKAKKVKVKGQETSDVDKNSKEVVIEYNLLDFIKNDTKAMEHDIKF